MSGRFVRQSSFRHVFGTAAKPENVYGDIRADVTGNGNHIVVNDKYFALSGTGGGGPIQICCLDKPGRQNNNAPKIAVHKGKVIDWAFNPFVSTMIATASEDCYAKVSQFPVGGPTELIDQPIVTLEGHTKKVTEVVFHPTANNVLGTLSSDGTLRIWDIEKQAEVINYDFGNQNEPYHMDWNTTGSLVSVTNKDKKLYVLDPRNPASANSVEAFSGNKVANVRWMDNKGFIGAVGGSKTAMRQLQIWDPRKLVKAVSNIDVDQSAGNIIPHYDPDNSIMYLAGKGDAGIKYFEIVEEDPYAHFLAEYRSNDSQKGVCFLPRRGLDAKSCEIAKGLRLMRDSVIPVSFQVPRKGDQFQADLYPDTFAGKATNDVEGYLGGKDTPPELATMNWKLKGDVQEEVVAFKAQKSAADLQGEVDAANAKIADLEKQIAALKAR